MTVKHVHWGPEQTFSISRTPSPSWSDNSLPESSSPYTPPSLFKGSPLPSHHAVDLNPLLAYNPHTRSPAILYDVSQRPSSARLRSKDLAQPVAYPALYSMEIHIPSLPCWKPIQLVATSRQTGITMAELLDTIYRFLQLPVSGQEYAYFPPAVQKNISIAFARRCERLGGSPAGAQAERSKGLKRVDCLLGNNMWVGLTRTGKDSQTWQLQLAPLVR